MEFHNETTLFSTEEKQNEIIETAEFPFGKTVLFMDKHKYVDKLEKAYPFIEIVNIETVFPNSYIIHANQREEIFAVKFDGGIYFCDADYKILEISNVEYNSTQTNLIFVETYTNIANNLEVGDFINIPEINILKTISPSFEQTNRDIFAQMALIKNIKIINTYNPLKPLADVAFGLELYDFAGLKCLVSAPENNLVNKINAFCAYQTAVVNPNEKYLYIYEENNEILVAERPIIA